MPDQKGSKTLAIPEDRNISAVYRSWRADLERGTQCMHVYRAMKRPEMVQPDRQRREPRSTIGQGLGGNRIFTA